jgi:hypothetical protein
MSEYVSLRIRLLSPGENGRTTPIAGSAHPAAYKPHLRVGGDGEYLGVAFVDGPPWIHPGEEAEVTAALIYTGTGVDYSGLQAGASISVVEGSHTVARGHVLRRWTEATDWQR